MNEDIFNGSIRKFHTRAAVAVFDAEASNKIVTCRLTSDRSMSGPFPVCRQSISDSWLGNLRECLAHLV